MWACNEADTDIIYEINLRLGSLRVLIRRGSSKKINVSCVHVL